jgi:hypothetical protein
MSETEGICNAAGTIERVEGRRQVRWDDGFVCMHTCRESEWGDELTRLYARLLVLVG